MEEVLLRYLIISETVFRTETDLQVAITLLQTFRLLHGPFSLQFKSFVVLPYFSSGYLDHNPSEKEQGITLKMEIVFKGLSLPEYVFHQMSIEMLRMFPDGTNSLTVGKNGVRVFHDLLHIQLVHDFHSRMVTIQVSSGVENISKCWAEIIRVSNTISTRVQEFWPASRMVHTFHCPHCLLKGDPHPQKQVPPTWCSNLSYTDASSTRVKEGMVTVLCGTDRVPSPLVHPCSGLSREDTETLKSAVEELRIEKELKSLPPNEESATCLSPLPLPKLQTVAAEDLSDLSDDDDDYLLPDNDPNQLEISLDQRPVSTSLAKIKSLYLNTDKVFPMTRIRGRALIINNNKFLNYEERHGSEADVENLTNMLQAFKFKVSTWNDVKAQDMLHIIKNEVKDRQHADYGTFWLCILSHGIDANYVFGSDGILVSLTDVYDLLAPLNFPAMADKPKLVIIQACSGVRKDGGKRGVDIVLQPDSTTSTAESTENRLMVARPLPSAINKPGGKEMERVNYDNMLIIKSSFETFVSIRHGTYGSLLIRCLVRTMYRHACHRDMYDIYKIVQDRIKKFCIKRDLSSGQLVVAQDTLAYGRKLYLFPGFNGPRRNS